MTKISNIIVDINDLYGRMVPGIIVIVSVCFILIRFMVPEQVSKLDHFIQVLYKDSLLLFCVASILLAFLVGHIPHFLMFRFFKWPFKYSPMRAIQLGDPTPDNKVTRFFTSAFSEDALHNKLSPVMNYCTDYLLQNSPDSYWTKRVIESGCNVRSGVVLPLIIAALVCLLYGYWLAAILLVIMATIFFGNWVRELEFEDRLIVRLYYHACNKAASNS